jgi:hypothetical protein
MTTATSSLPTYHQWYDYINSSMSEQTVTEMDDINHPLDRNDGWYWSSFQYENMYYIMTPR